MPLLNECSCIPNHKFGFREKHITIHQTHELVNVIGGAFEEKNNKISIG